MSVKTLLLISAGVIAASVSALTVSDVSARQRYPWNNLIDIDFTLGDAPADAQFKIDVKASYLGDTRILDARMFVTDPVVKPGTRRITWDIGKDFPGFKADDLRVAVIATPFTNGTDGVYMVIDLSGGKDAANYPVRYTTTPPKHSVNALDACKTTEMWLKRIRCGSFMFCAGDNDSGKFEVNLTKDFYMGIFECTQRQWAQITGNWPSKFSNPEFRETRPCDSIDLYKIFGHNLWPKNTEPSSGSPVMMMRQKTGLANFSLPTKAQWEYANRCGSQSRLHSCYSYSEIRHGMSFDFKNATSADFQCGLENGPVCVGTHKPNVWGIYEMFGNVIESCLDAGVEADKLQKYYGLRQGLAIEDCTVENIVVNDPEGGPVKGMYGDDSPYKAYEPSMEYFHVLRGAGWTLSSAWINQFTRWTNPDGYAAMRGVRFVVTCD
jgi:formylglycine-generating enzyme required for sulfatase activity